MKDIDDIERTGPDDGELLAGLHRSLAGAVMTTGAGEVVALGRRIRNRRRAGLAGIATGAAALVAAVGVLAPATSGGRSQNVGFTMEYRADGRIELTLTQAVEPEALRNAMDDAGVASDVQTVQVPAAWDFNKGMECTAASGVKFATGSDALQVEVLPNGKKDFSRMVIDKSKLAPGQMIFLVRFEAGDERYFVNFGLVNGKPGTCVPTQDFAHNRV